MDSTRTRGGADSADNGNSLPNVLTVVAETGLMIGMAGVFATIVWVMMNALVWLMTT